MSPAAAPPLRVLSPPGLVPYAQGLALQHATVAARQEDRIPDTLIVLQHEPVITLGRNADPSGLLATAERLRAEGIALHRAERGGQATYHGPGQWVLYPILNLRELGLGVRRYVEGLERVMLRAASAFGVTAHTVPGRPGIFCDGGKLGALGVAVSRGVCYHGLAFNVAPNLAHYRWIVPCGLTDVQPTSLAEHMTETPEMETVLETLLEAVDEVFG